MFALVCDPHWRISSVGTELTVLTGLDPVELLGHHLGEVLVDPSILRDLEAGTPVRAAFAVPAGGSVSVWLQRLAVSGGDGPRHVVIGDRSSTRILGLELMPGAHSLNSIEVAVTIEDHAGYIAFANTRLLEMLGYSEAELVGKHWTSIVPADERRWVEQQLRARLRGERNQYETTIIAKHNERIPVIVTARPILDRGAYRGTVATFTDITERKRAEQETRLRSERMEQLNRALNEQRARLLELTDELARANEELKRLSAAKSDFVAAVSHDLRTPMTTIIEGMAMVEDGTLGPVNEEQRKFLRYAIEDAQRLGEFINDILDIAKIEAGKITIRKGRVDVTERVRRALRSYETLVRDKGIELVAQLPEEPVFAFCDSGHYDRVITNLLSNAIKFTTAGSITVRVARGLDKRILTSVRDTGIGIPEDQRHVIFGKFEQVRRTGAYMRPGSGLGLSLCKQLVELNEGVIDFFSEEGRGSDFYFTLPEYDEITGLSHALATVSGAARSVAGHLFVVGFRLPSSVGMADFERIADLIRQRLTDFDSVQVMPSHHQVMLISAQHEGGAKHTFDELVKVVKATGIPNVQAGFLLFVDHLPDAQEVITRLKRSLEPLP